jgi:putative endonuclease
VRASKQNGTLYVGVTSNLIRRVHQHKTNAIDGFTKKYGVHQLVYFETFDDSLAAISREKAIKHWTRRKRLQTIEAGNPLWRDLYEALV